MEERKGQDGTGPWMYQVSKSHEFHFTNTKEPPIGPLNATPPPCPGLIDGSVTLSLANFLRTRLECVLLRITQTIKMLSFELQGK